MSASYGSKVSRSFQKAANVFLETHEDWTYSTIESEDDFSEDYLTKVTDIYNISRSDVVGQKIIRFGVPYSREDFEWKKINEELGSDPEQQEGFNLLHDVLYLSEEYGDTITAVEDPAEGLRIAAGEAEENGELLDADALTYTARQIENKAKKPLN